MPALVTAVAPKGGNGGARVRIGTHEVELSKAALAWTRKASAADFLKVGDLVQVEVRTIQGGVPQTIALEQEPVVEGALLAIDNRTGQVRAMVGGFDFARSKFNRSVQAKVLNSLSHSTARPRRPAAVPCSTILAISALSSNTK